MLDDTQHHDRSFSSAGANAPPQEPRAGDKLAAARRRLGLSYEILVERTRVRRDYLEALESMDVKLLPGRAYTLAYLRSYARVLGLDPEVLVRQFERESALTREDPLPQLRNPESKPAPARPWWAAAAIGLAMLGFIAWRVAATPVEGPAQDDLLIGGVGGAAAPTAARLASQPAAVGAVEIAALGAGWLEARGPDGTVFYSRIMRAGERFRPEVGAGWVLYAKDGSTFEVLVDGASRGALAREGLPVIGRSVDGLAVRTLADGGAVLR